MNKNNDILTLPRERPDTPDNDPMFERLNMLFESCPADRCPCKFSRRCFAIQDRIAGLSSRHKRAFRETKKLHFAQAVFYALAIRRLLIRVSAEHGESVIVVACILGSVKILF